MILGTKTLEKLRILINEETEYTIDDLLIDRYGIDLDYYCKIIKDLLPFTPKVQAGISKEFYHAFLDEKNHRMIVKQKSTK